MAIRLPSQIEMGLRGGGVDFSSNLPSAKSKALDKPLSNSSAGFAETLAKKDSGEKISSNASRETGRGLQRPDDSLKGGFADRLEGRVPAEKNDETVSRAGSIEERVNNNRSLNQKSDENVDNLTHRQALQQFLKRMKNELGVDAEQILAAFATLTEQELLQPPELSLQKLIEVLPLAPEQKALAKNIFQDMLKQTAARGMADYLTSSKRQLSLEVLSDSESRQRKMDQGVTNMQNQFFAVPGQLQQPMTEVTKPVASPTQAINKYQTQMQSQRSTDAAKYAAASASVPLKAEAASASATSSEAAGASFFPSMMSDGNAVSVGELVSEPSLTKTTPAPTNKMVSAETSLKPTAMPIPAEMMMTPQAPAMAMSEQSALYSSALNAPLMATSTPVVSKEISSNFLTASSPKTESMALGESMGMSSGTEVVSANSESEKPNPEEFFNETGQDMYGLDAQNQSTKESQLSTKDGFVINTKPTPEQDAANIKEIIDRAQFMARKGGGEMKVTMSPHGLGEVNMRVSIEGGQVSVEMVTESHDVKKLLEKGLGDLKSTLAAQNLRVDQIRVDTANDVSRQLTQQHDEAQRQFAQQFMEQFRQENNEWRRGFYDISSARSYGSQKDSAQQAPIIGGDRPRKSASSRRLDLVA